MPLALSLRHFTGHAEQHRHMNIVTASVHHADVLALGICGAHSRCVIEAGLFLYRQRIHIGANQHARSSAILQNGNHTVGLRAILVFAHALRNGVPQLAQFCCEQRRRLFLVVRKLGVAMQMLVGLGKRGKLALG